MIDSHDSASDASTCMIIRFKKKDLKFVYATRATEMVLDDKINDLLETELAEIRLTAHYKASQMVLDRVAKTGNRRRFHSSFDETGCITDFQGFIEFNRYGILNDKHRKYNYVITELDADKKKKENRWVFRFMHAGIASDGSIKDLRAKHLILNGDKGSVKMAGEFYFHTSEYEGQQQVFLLIDLCSGTFRPSQKKLAVYIDLLSTVFGFNKSETVLDQKEMTGSDGLKILFTMTKLWNNANPNIGVKIITGNRLEDGEKTPMPACVADHLAHFHLVYRH
eukprot:CAMPEP_0202704930 /NCGR_PEP_ID=MMETSP1385-20130828/17533_1 /ASSEMBLY_ACC=CAM_ASM_000861 /TAXON_ID=933848 /ORGANISM="Elphidium margaritaceum" /LENGTH=279 /DNA_ID=CAMNT_0049363055 /DNA_START=188 /DNA_END=1027 /DNA_ORIENTATION=-